MSLFFRFLVNLVTQINELKCFEQLIDFLCEISCKSEFFSIKKQNNFEKRIFSFDKPNKYYDEIQLKNYCLCVILSLIESQP